MRNLTPNLCGEPAGGAEQSSRIAKFLFWLVGQESLRREQPIILDGRSFFASPIAGPSWPAWATGNGRGAVLVRRLQLLE